MFCKKGLTAFFRFLTVRVRFFIGALSSILAPKFLRMKLKSIIGGTLSVAFASAFIQASLPKGVDTASIDKSIAPQTDFFQYANGNWIKNNPIPAAESRWSAFNIVAERNNELLKTILERAAKNTKAPIGSNEYKIGVFYKTAMDTAKLEKQKFSELTRLMHLVDEIQTTEQLTTALGKLHEQGINALFGFEVSQDVKNSNQYAAYLSQSGLGLPDKDYYLKTDARSVSIRSAYSKYINTVFGYYDQTGAAHFADQVMEFETKLAESCMSRTERRNMEKQYNPMPLEELRAKFPTIQWDVYFKTIGIPMKFLNRVIVMQPDFMVTADAMMNSDLVAFKTYLKWKILNGTSSYLHADVANASFDFYGKTLTGAKEQKPRWKRTINSANSLIGELVAQEYVKVAFTPESKQRVNVMVDNLRESFRERINNLDWMSAATKQKALEKLNSFTRKLGYPDKWTDLSQLEVTSSSYVQNFFNSNKFWFHFNLNKLGKPVDKTEWEMLPQTVNAYYNPVNNEIVFPAAIMQPPFFDPKADDAVNYGAIGAVIGHEFSHGFDDQGSKYDAQGNMNDWWTEDDRKLFDARTQVLVNQFNHFEVLDSVFVNGELTLGENIAELAGLTVAYDAYQRSLKGKQRTMIDGYTPEQRFFIGFGQVWRGHARNEFLRQQVVTDPHSPAKFRVIGTLSNMPQFYEAFKVKAGDSMWRPDSTRAKIW